ncbi:MAG: 4Fe-4S ferredoxin [Desulfobulbus sp.]
MTVPANNALEPGFDVPAFSRPLVGFACGDDPLFPFLKNDIGAKFYWTPVDAFTQAFPEASLQAEDLSVIAWILPQTEETRRAHRQEVDLPAIAWSKARHYGEQVNEQLRRAVVSWFQVAGIQACAPVLLGQWSRARSLRYGFASSWSERHAAHVCGLGTFGLSDGLITPAGKAVRVGSVIVRKRYPATPRAYTSHNQWCLAAGGGKCRACIRRCPAEAISESGHDKEKCKAYIRTTTALHVEQQLGFRVNSCGLCQTKVPCEHRNPRAPRVDSGQA